MITATFKELKNTKSISLKVKGHAMSAPEGHDLICAASSAYGFQAIQMVENMYHSEWLTRKPKMWINHGDIHITLRPKEEYYTIVFNMMQVIAIGYQILEDKYPEYVQLTVFSEP